MSSNAAVGLEQVGPVMVVRVTGELDMASEDLLRRHLTEAMAAEPETLVLDLTGVTFFASAGLHVLVDVQHDATAKGLDLRVVADSRIVLRPMEITGVDQLVTVVSSVDQALAHS
ncbi:STAS domain-containing protein [Kutzneria kofuensis]|uniref:Anti-sigma factor antagonist n=1 Tax=Kutzneria kofuensis TaxID=103725 RepID=A0A7W9KNE8_9PSEU|nr:STAS domain-containing protein [Kutzneria kofuensis]MBB5895770.1 anti-anti-sigma factor [Kutzneria kofuensis]